MIIKLGLYSSIISAVKELADTLSKSMREMGTGMDVLVGWKVAELKITCKKRPSDEQIKKMKDMVIEDFKKRFPKMNWWIKEEK